MFRVAIFDLEGTLVDYNRRFEIYWTKRLLRTFGTTIGSRKLKNIKDKEVKEYLALDIRSREKKLLSWGYSSVREFLNGWNTEEALSAKEKFLYCYKDVGALLDLERNGIKLGIVTSAPKSLADRELKLLRETLGKNIFKVVVYASYGSGIKMKPAPDSILLCLRQLGSSPEDAVYVGNEDVDILAAKNAGVRDILINRRRYKITVPPSITISSLKGLSDIIIGRK